MARLVQPRLALVFLLPVLATIGTGPLRAQPSFVADLFKSARTLNVNWEFYQPTMQPIGVSPGRMRGMLFEVSFLLTTFGSARAQMVVVDSVVERDSTVPLRGGGQGASVTVKRVPRVVPPSDSVWSEGSLELALGYGVVTGFNSNDSAYTVYGSVEEFPVLSLYASGPPLKLFSFKRAQRRASWTMQPYLGARVGLARLTGFQAFVADTGNTSIAFTATANSYLLGAMAGLEVATPWGVEVFIEGGVTQRRFDGIQWAAGSSVVPDRLTKQIQLRTYGLTTGVQLQLKP